MGKWRDVFEGQLSPPGDREHGLEYLYDPPATEDQLRRAEAQLGFRLPDDLRELLREFNGIRYSTTYSRELGHPPDQLFLDAESIAGVTSRPEMRDMLLDRDELLGEEEEDESPSPGNDLRKIAFFCQKNRGAEMYGICPEEVAGFAAGAVVRLDHESSGEILDGYPDLLSFMRSGRAS